MTLPLARLKKYGLAAPCADDVRSSVAAVDYRNFTENWKTACATAGIRPEANLLSLEDLHALAAALSQVSGPISLMGRALEIRLASYEQLAELGDDEIRSTDFSRRIFENLIRTRVPDGDVIREVYSLDLFSSENKQKLDEAARRAANVLHTDVGLVNILLGGAQAMAGRYGSVAWADKAGGTPIEWAFCATTVRRNGAYVVPNAETDVMQRSNPLVEFGDTRCYAGVPLTASNGVVVGSVCAINNKAKTIDDEIVDGLREIADALSSDLESVRDGRRILQGVS